MPRPKKHTTTIIVVMLLIVLGLGAIWLGPRKKDYTSSELFSASPEDVTHIELIRNGETVAFKKVDQKWRIIEPISAPALGVYIHKMAKDLLEAPVVRTISKKPEAAEKYGLTAEGTHVILTSTDTVVADSVLGSQTTDYHQIIKKTDEDTIYAVRNIQKALYDQDLLMFRDKTIFSLRQNDIVHIAIQSGESKFSFQKSGDKWATDKEDFVLDMNALNALIASLTSLQAKDFSEEKEIGDIQGSIEIKTQNHLLHKLEIGQKTPEGLYNVQKDGEETRYLVEVATVNRLLNSLETYRNIVEVSPSE